MEKFFTAKNDKVFKAIFANPYDTSLLEILLSEILGKQVSNIHFLNVELLKRNVIERAKIVDLLVDVDGLRTHIEVNSSFQSWLHTRNFNFFTVFYNTETQSGKDYNPNIPFLHIDFTYGISSKIPKVVEYEVQSKESFHYIFNFRILEFNMDFIKNACYNDNEKESLLYRHLAILDYNEEELNALPKGDVFMDKYKEKVFALNHDKEFRSFLSYEEDQQFQKNSEMREAEERGKEKGLIMGLEAGKEEKMEEIAKNLLQDNHLSIDYISKNTGLSMETLQKLKEELDNK